MLWGGVHACAASFSEASQGKYFNQRPEDYSGKVIAISMEGRWLRVVAFFFVSFFLFASAKKRKKNHGNFK